MEKAASSFLPPSEKRWAKNFTITINPTRTAVAIYPKADWDGQLERLSHINPMDKIGLQYERYLMSVSFPETAWTRRAAY